MLQTSLLTSHVLGCNGTPTVEDFKIAWLTTILLDLVVCIACTVAILLIILFRGYKRFLTRLLLYLVLNTLCYTIIDATQLAAITVDEYNNTLYLHESLCRAVAFLSQFFRLLYIFTLCGAVLHIFFLCVYQKNIHTQAREICMSILIVCVSLAISLIPFVHTAYGWSDGMNCWIRTVHVNATDCTSFKLGRAEQFILWYIPFGIASVLMITLMGIAVRYLYKHSQAEGTGQLSLQLQYREALKEAVAFLVYIALLITLEFTSFVVHLTIVYGHGSPKEWIIDAMIDPILSLCVPAAFIFHPATLKKLRRSELKKAIRKWKQRNLEETVTTYVVEPEFSLEFSCRQELVIRGTGVKTQNYLTIEGVETN